MDNRKVTLKKVVMIGIFGAVLYGSYSIAEKMSRPASQPLAEKVIRASDVSMEKLKTKRNIAPCLIIGSGPAGLSAALYASRLGIDTYVLEGNEPGGLLMKTTEVENWPGKLSIQGPDIIKDLHEQAENAGANFIIDAVSHIDLSQWPYKVTTENDSEFYALSIILATGATPRLPGVEGQDAYWGRGITTCAVCDASFYIDMDVAVLGGGDSALEEAMQLAKSKSVKILVRKDKMRASDAMKERLKGYPNISVMYNVEVKKVIGDGTKVTGLQLFNNKTKKQVELSVSGLFIAIGHDPNSDLLKTKAAINKAGYLQLVDRSQAVKRKNSNEAIPGLFAAGDVEDEVYRQAGVAAGSGIKAALDAYYYLNKLGYDSTVAQSIKSRLIKLDKLDKSSQTVQEIKSLEALQELLESKEELILLDFYTQNCPICFQMMPVIEQVIQDEKYAGKVLLVKINADVASDIAKKYDVIKVPTVLFVKKNTVLKRTGFLIKSELNNLLQKMVD